MRDIATADEIALALVTACRLTGEDPIAVARGCAGSRARHYAYQGIVNFYPNVNKSVLAGGVGYSTPHTHYTHIAYAKKAQWWEDRIADEVELALMNGAPPPVVHPRPVHLVNVTASLMGDPSPERSALQVRP